MLSRRWPLEALGAILLERFMTVLAPQYSLFVYTSIALLFTCEVFLSLVNNKAIGSYLINFHRKAGSPMAFLIVAIFGAVLAMGYYYGMQKIFIEKQKTKKIPEQADSNKFPSLTLHRKDKQDNKQLKLIEKKLDAIQQSSNFKIGNLSKRTTDLSNGIMSQLHSQGWPEHEDSMQSDMFKFNYLDKTRKIRDEYALLHIRDNNLDHFLEYIDQSGNPIIQSSVISKIAERLNVMAQEIKK